MHNLFLGLAIHTTKLWRDVGVLHYHDYAIIQDHMDSVVVPSKIGRIPRKPASNFVAFTADEWKHWAMIYRYSLYALHGIFLEHHYKCWCNFVKACSIFLQVQVFHHDITIAFQYLVDFCLQFQAICGPENLTPNMYMALHLGDCVLDYRALSSF